jgi:DNA-binding response OmpR family regulator
MPDGSGFDVIRRVKQSQPWIKVLAISGGSRFLTAAAGADQAAEVGADGIILKPFDEERLLSRISACWENEEKPAAREVAERIALRR